MKTPDNWKAKRKAFDLSGVCSKCYQEKTDLVKAGKRLIKGKILQVWICRPCASARFQRYYKPTSAKRAIAPPEPSCGLTDDCGGESQKIVSA